MALIHNRSFFTDKQMIKLQEAPGLFNHASIYIPIHPFLEDMPPGQTPHTVVLYAHHDLVDKVQPGDR